MVVNDGTWLGGLEDPCESIQDRIQRFVQTNPGVTISDVADLIGTTHSTATYHLNRLVRRNQLVPRREGRVVRHFLPEDASDPVTRLAALMATEQQHEIVAFLLAKPVERMTINQVAKALDLPFARVKGTMGALETLGMLRLERRRGRYHIRPQPSLRWAFSPPTPRPDMSIQ